MIDEMVLVSERDGVAILTLNRPSSRNAINLDLAQAIVGAFEACQDHRAIVVTGADPAFCAGMDLRDLGAPNLKSIPRFLPAVQNSRPPVIAAVNGPAVTAGLELALMCDFMIASERACFADTHLRVGVYPGPVAIELPRRIGIARARQMLLTSEFVDAATAERIGLVNQVVPHDRLVDVAVDIGIELAQADPELAGLLREQLQLTFGQPLEEARRIHADFASRAPSLQTTEQLAERRAALIERSRSLRNEGHDK